MKITNWAQAVRKAIEWRAISYFIDLSIAMLLTHKFEVAVGIASTAAAVKFITNLIWIRKRFS